MGIVYRATDRRLKRTVAIKVLPPELGFRSEIRTRFLREAETAAQLSHPNIVPIYSVGEQENLVYFVMACVEGMNIAQLLAMRGPFGAAQTRQILREVADALAYAHQSGVVHRDIKPDNIIVDAASGRPMVTDFGIARAVTDTDSRLTATGIAIGTPAFMSPEQSLGEKEVDGRSDLYSLGVVGYQMLCGSLPFEAANTPAMLMKHISATPTHIEVRRPGLPADLAKVVMLLLEKDARNRVQSAEALASALESGDVPEGAVYGSRDEHSAPARTQAVSPSPADVDADSLDYDTEQDEEPTSEELRRWAAPNVTRFRRNVAFFVPINTAIVIFAVALNVDGAVGLSLMWTVYMAYKYSGLWADGYDWRDVFRQPRHRTIWHLASETIDRIESLSDASKRRQLRARVRRHSRRSSPPDQHDAKAAEEPTASGRRRGRHARNRRRDSSDAQNPLVAAAAVDRDEILRQIAAMPKRDRANVKDVAASAEALYKRVVALSALPRGETRHMADALGVMEREIRDLEAQANPLDVENSEARVRRLAFLKRQHRALAESEESVRNTGNKLDECVASLRVMRLDIARLNAGTQSLGQVSQLAARAISLADDVDGALAAAAEVSNALNSRQGGFTLERP
jgi:serine/threonine-protein kinase